MGMGSNCSNRPTANWLDCSNRMARTGKTVVETARQTSAISSFIQWFFQPAMLFRASLVAGVCALWPYVAQKLPSLEGRPEYQISFTQIQVSPLPKHPVPQNLVEQVAEQSGVPSKVSLLSESLTSDIAAAFRRHPWVAKVVRVQKSFPAAVTVELEYRQPVLMAQVPGGRIPVDINGVLLPTADFSASDTNRFPVVQYTGAKPKIRPGAIWNEPNIVAAARLANLLGEKWKPLKLEAIVIPQLAEPSTDPKDILLELTGIGGSRIVWGRAPGSDHPGELEPTQKIRRLEKYLADYGDYAQPHGPYEIDIRHWQEITRRPLATPQAQVKPSKLPRTNPKKAADGASGKLREASALQPEKKR